MTTVFCAFCCSRRLPCTDHSAEECSVLSTHQCTYCKEFGHTNSRCPKSLNKKQRAQEEAKFKSNCWASVASKHISPEDAAKIAAENRIIKEESEARRRRQEEKERARRQEAKKQWELNYPNRMKMRYGLKRPFTVPVGVVYSVYSSLPHIDLYFPYGEFWYFYVEGTRDDHPIAKTLREDMPNRRHFHVYLMEELWENWLQDSEDTDLDCQYLTDLRHQKRLAEENACYDRMEEDRKLDLEFKEESRQRVTQLIAMYKAVANRRISWKAFERWESETLEDEMDGADSYHCEGIALYEMDRRTGIASMKAKQEWEKRKAAREKMN